jgi:lysophospholipase L1-like esterase
MLTLSKGSTMLRKVPPYFVTPVLIIIVCAIAVAQQPPQPSDAPAQQSVPTPTPSTPPMTGSQRTQLWRQSRSSTYMDDFGELARYHAANATLAPLKPDENRVVFFGDSITDGWRLFEYFPDKPYINRGISGQTTSQMLVRFREDVIDLQPKAVVILAGTNDIAGNTGPMSLEEIEANYATLAELARVHNIKVIYSSVLPVHQYTERATDMFTQRPPEKILALNRWLKDYCSTPVNGCTYLDYFSAMVDDKGYMKKELADDGLHPNAAGYKVMAPLVQAAIDKVLTGGSN